MKFYEIFHFRSDISGHSKAFRLSLNFLIQLIRSDIEIRYDKYKWCMISLIPSLVKKEDFPFFETRVTKKFKLCWRVPFIMKIYNLDVLKELDGAIFNFSIPKFHVTQIFDYQRKTQIPDWILPIVLGYHSFYKYWLYRVVRVSSWTILEHRKSCLMTSI